MVSIRFNLRRLWRSGARRRLDQHAQRAVLRIKPIFVIEFLSVAAQPSEILVLVICKTAAGEEIALPERFVFAAQRKKHACKFKKLALRRIELPMHPARGVVLAVGIVVAVLRASHLVA